MTRKRARYSLVAICLGLTLMLTGLFITKYPQLVILGNIVFDYEGNVVLPDALLLPFLLFMLGMLMVAAVIRVHQKD